MSEELDQILQAFLQESLTMIERITTRAMRDGRKISELAFDLERGLDTKVRGGCAPRAAVAKRWLTHPELSEAKRQEMHDEIINSAPTEIPVVMTLIIDARYKVYGVKRLTGDVFIAGPSN